MEGRGVTGFWENGSKVHYKSQRSNWSEIFFRLNEMSKEESTEERTAEGLRGCSYIPF